MSELNRIAILGTAHTTGEAASDTAADSLIEQLALPAEERERALLLRAGGAAILRRAGTLAETAPALPSAAPPETLRRASPELAGLLAGLLAGDARDLLSEALENMATAGLRLPEELLPLALAEYDPALRERLRPVLGRRGRWLADQSGSWLDSAEADYVWAWARSGAETRAAELPPDADERWQEGAQGEREELLVLARRVAPSRALEWVQSTFKSDRPEQRKRWLELLVEGLSVADSPFLESAAQDRSATVRLVAARTLWRLPESALARAVREQVDALLAPQSALRVELPSEPFDRDLDRLGIVETPPDGVGRRQWWLSQLLSALPPSHYAAHFARSPEELVALAMQHELALALLDGFTAGALRFADRAWFAPLWDAWQSLELARGWLEPEPLPRLTEALLIAPAELASRLVRCIEQGRRVELLSSLPRPWPESVARAFSAALVARAAWFPRVWASAATRLPLELVPTELAADSALPGKKPPFDDALQKFKSVIDLRWRLAREISAPQPTKEEMP